MSDTREKEKLIKEYRQLRKDYGYDIPRDTFRRISKISDHKIAKLFGNYTNYKYEANLDIECTQTCNNPEDVDTVTSVDNSLYEYTESISLNTEKVHYNAENQTYVVYCPSAKGNVILSKSTVDSMFDAYSNFDGTPATINEVCRSFGIPRRVFIDIKTAFGWTHDSIPITGETMSAKTEDELVEDLIQKKLFSIEQRYKREKWKQIENKAKKWDNFKLGVIDPFESFLSTWKPKKLPKLNVPKRQLNGDKVFIMTCSDWHIGAYADGRKLSKQDEWDTWKAIGAIDTYAQQIATNVEPIIQQYSHCEILFMGDLHHGFNGKTAKGTELITDILAEDQYEIVLGVIVNTIQRMLDIFGKVIVRSVRGNHDGFDYYPVIRAAEIWFRNCPEVTFNIYQGRTAVFRVKDVLFLMDHGESDTIHASVPKGVIQREAHISRILLAKPELLQNVKQKIFLQGHLHTYEQKEYAGFEFVTVGALPKGDKYADDMNFGGRPRQNCLVVDSTGLRSVEHYYV